jgi:phosphoesterase RecJ-like protein
MNTLEEIAKRIKQAKQVAIFTHMRPDGDAFGSSLALSSALDNLGIENEVCVESDIPSNLSFIAGLDKVQKKPTKAYDLFVSVDCSDVLRFGGLESEFYLAQKRKIDTINIDHHISNPLFAKLNYVRECSANCMNVANLIAYLGAPFDKKTAEYLTIGLLTDSGNFAHDDVNEETLLLAAKLVKAGADMHHLNYMLFKRQSKARALLYNLTYDLKYF